MYQGTYHVSGGLNRSIAQSRIVRMCVGDSMDGWMYVGFLSVMLHKIELAENPQKSSPTLFCGWEVQAKLPTVGLTQDWASA